MSTYVVSVSAGTLRELLNRLPCYMKASPSFPIVRMQKTRKKGNIPTQLTSTTHLMHRKLFISSSSHFT